MIQKISEEFPDVKIDYKFAAEDTGYNCGNVIFLNGVLKDCSPKGGTKEAYELAFELSPEGKSHYKFKDGNYIYVGK